MESRAGDCRGDGDGGEEDDVMTGRLGSGKVILGRLEMVGVGVCVEEDVYKSGVADEDHSEERIVEGGFV